MVKSFLFSFLLVAFISCNKTTKSVKKEVKEIAKEIMVHAKNCALITIDSLGVAHVRTMDPFLPDENFTVWMGTNANSLKIRQIKNNPKVSLYYFHKESVSYVTLQGTASIINTATAKEKFWKNEWERFYKNKTTDYALIKFIPNKINIISEKYSILGDSITWQTPQVIF